MQFECRLGRAEKVDDCRGPGGRHRLRWDWILTRRRSESRAIVMPGMGDSSESAAKQSDQVTNAAGRIRKVGLIPDPATLRMNSN